MLFRKAFLGSTKSIKLFIRNQKIKRQDLKTAHLIVKNRKKSNLLSTQFIKMALQETNKKYKKEGTVIVHKISDAEFFAKENDYKELMILGGANVYKQTIDDADKIYITRVHHVFEDADAFFPAIDESKWKMVSSEDHFKDDKHAYDYSFQLWQRK